MLCSKVLARLAMLFVTLFALALPAAADTVTIEDGLKVRTIEVEARTGVIVVEDGLKVRHFEVAYDEDGFLVEAGVNTVEDGLKVRHEATEGVHAPRIGFVEGMVKITNPNPYDMRVSVRTAGISGRDNDTWPVNVPAGKTIMVKDNSLTVAGSHNVTVSAWTDAGTMRPFAINYVR